MSELKVNTIYGSSTVEAPNFPVGANVQSLNSGALAGFRNLIINGDQKISQRGNTFTSNTSTLYTTDRWITTETGANLTVTQGVEDGKYYLRKAGAASHTSGYIAQRIESHNVSHLSGKNLTLSFELYSNVSVTITPSLYHANTADNFTATTLIGSFDPITTSTTGWVNYTGTFPSTMPTNVINGLELRLSHGALTSGEIRVTNIQLEQGTTATIYERRSIGQELVLCQRYYWRGRPLIAANFAVYATSASVTIPVQFPVTMRVTPTLRQDMTGTAYSVLSNAPTFDSGTVHGARWLFFSTGANINANFVLGANAFLDASAEL